MRCVRKDVGVFGAMLVAIFGWVGAVMAEDVDARKAEIEKRSEAPSPEALERRARSVAQLREEGVPVLETLPVISSEADSKRRTSEEVVNRAVALCVVALKGEGLEQAVIDQIVEAYGVAPFLTPDELAFIAEPEPDDFDRIQFVWRYEAYAVLLWAVGLLDELPRPDVICDVPKVAGLLGELGRDGMLERAALRPQAELLDAADLIYRYHWAVRDAGLNGREMPAGLERGVVIERHHALNWLIGYMDQAWDDVSTDT